MRLITRSDDLGLNRSANAAIARVIAAGWIRNVSVMAVGAALAEAAELVDAPVCFGLHGTLTAEWEAVKWRSLSRQSALDACDGAMVPTVAAFGALSLPAEVILREYDCQLDHLTRLGFPISYVDSHMEAVRVCPEYDSAVRQWAAGHGLVYAADFGTPLSPLLFELPQRPDLFVRCLQQPPHALCLYIGHPALYGEDTLPLYNARNPGRTAALQRHLDYLFAADPCTADLCRRYGAAPVTYCQAALAGIF